MKIIIDQNDGKFYGKVDVDEAKITSDSQRVLFTNDLVSCVGLIMIDKISKKKFKRGLAHIHYSPNVLTGETSDRDKYTMIPKKEEIRKIKPGLDEFISNFKLDPRAMLVFNSFKKSRIGNFENPMANYLLHYLVDNGVGFYFPGNFTDNDLSGSIKKDLKTKIYNWGEDYGNTYYKNIGLHKSKLVVQHMSKPRRDRNDNLAKYGISLGIKEFSLNLNL